MMGRHNVLILFAFLVEGVFGDAAEVKSVNDGDPVLLTTGVLKKKNETVWWYFNDTLIATIDGICCLYDGKHGIFRDRLMLDCKTGSLIITDIKAAHTGLYEAKIKSEDTSGKIEKCESTKIIQKNDNHGETVKLSSLTVSAEVKSVKEGELVILTTDGNKEPTDTLRWYFNDTLIALINGDPNKTCLYEAVHGIFRDRLMLDCKTGSLIITDIKAAHTGLYEAKIKSEDTSGKIEKLNRDLKCESTKLIQKNDNHGETVKLSSLTVSASDFGKNNNENQIDPQDKEKISSGPSSDVSALVAGIVGGGVVVLLLAVAVAVVFGVVKFTHCSIFDMKKIKQVPENKPCLPAQNGSVQ